MSNLGVLGATALSFTLAIAAPAFAAGRGGMQGGWSGGGHASAGPGRAGPAVSGAAVGSGTRFGNAQASIGAGRAGPAFSSGPTVRSSNFVGRSSGQFAQGGMRVDRDHGRRFGRGFGFGAGLVAGSALGYGYYDPYYYDNYAYDDYYAPGYAVSSVVDPSYCAQRYRSYDPASGTYLGLDGLRHPCGE